MLNKLKLLLILTLGFLPIGLAITPGVAQASTVQDSIQSGVDQASGNSSAGSDPAGSIADTIKTVLNVLSAIAGVAAVIMVVVAGFRLVVGAGSEGSVKAAKSSIVYAVVGIIIVALAQVIVHFVIYSITNNKPNQTPSTMNGDSSTTTSGYDQTSHANIH